MNECIWVGVTAAVVHLRDDRQAKQAQIRDVNAKRCGNCDHWMKTTCVSEKQHGQLKSNYSTACGAFTLSPSSKRSNDQFVVDLAEINRKLGEQRK
jgi:hypothetical protein